MRYNTKRIAAVLASVLLLSAAAGAAAAVSFDSETTTTSTQSDVSGSSTTVTAHWGNSSDALYVETDGATTSDLKLELTPAQSGVDYVAYSNTTPDTVNDSNGHYAFNVTYAELDDIPRAYSGATYNLTVYNASNDTAILETEVTFSTASGASENAHMAVTDDAGTDGAAKTDLVADRLTLEAADEGILGALSMDDNETQIATWSGYTTVNGTDSDVVIHLANSSTADAYSEAATDYESGEWIQESTIWINGVPHKVYKGEVPDDVESSETTVVYDSSADTVTADLNGDEYENVQTVSVRSTANKGYGFGELWSNFGTWTALRTLSPV